MFVAKIEHLNSPESSAVFVQPNAGKIFFSIFNNAFESKRLKQVYLFVHIISEMTEKIDCNCL